MPVARKSPPPPPAAATPPPPVDEAPSLEPRRRTAKMAKLEEAVGGIYVLLGGGISSLPPSVVPMQFKMVGLSLAKSADDIAEAWVDLAEDDAKVRKVLESLTSYSGWGKVAGVHLMAVGASVPALAAAMPNPVANAQAMAGQGNGGGMSAEDVATLMALGDLVRQQQTQQRQPEAAPMQPEQPIQQEPRVRVAPQPAPVTTRPRAGMPSAADMGVSIPDAPLDFPGSGAENVRSG